MAIGGGWGRLRDGLYQGLRSGLTMLGIRPPVQRSPEKEKKLVDEARHVAGLASQALLHWRGEETGENGCPGCKKAMVYAANPGGNKVKIVCLQCGTKVYVQDASRKEIKQAEVDIQRLKLENQVLQHEETLPQPQTHITRRHSI